LPAKAACREIGVTVGIQAKRAFFLDGAGQATRLEAFFQDQPLINGQAVNEDEGNAREGLLASWWPMNPGI